MIACEADPDLDPKETLREVDGFADAARAAGGTADDIVGVLLAAGFAGDRDRYDDPENSFLNRVLERRRGLPILLSALTVAVADRVGVPIVGIGLPGHFVVCDRSVPGGRYLDAFSGWQPLGGDALDGIMRSHGGGGAVDAYLGPVGAAAMARRMLLNLRGSYLRRRRLTDALWTVELEQIVDPSDAGVRLRGRALLIALGRYDEAERSARADLADGPDSEYAADTTAQLRAIAELRVSMN